jgi:hypothetical protein
MEKRIKQWTIASSEDIKYDSEDNWYKLEDGKNKSKMRNALISEKIAN